MKERMEELIEIINEADYNYHTLDNPTITDQEYDKYLRELFEIEEEHPEWVREDSPTQHAGGKIIEGFEKVTHKIPMMSLADVFNEDEIRDFDDRIRKEGINTVFNVKTPNFDEEILLTMPGLFNVENALAAIATAVELNIPYENIYNGLKNAKASGRMEVYENKNKDVTVIVDYAHNKLSFKKLYESTIKEYPKKEIITVFGCPGNHAQNRRKDLGELSGKYSKMNYLTTEDPRNEEPEEKHTGSYRPVKKSE